MLWAVLECQGNRTLPQEPEFSSSNQFYNLRSPVYCDVSLTMSFSRVSLSSGTYNNERKTGTGSIIELWVRSEQINGSPTGSERHGGWGYQPSLYWNAAQTIMESTFLTCESKQMVPTLETSVITHLAKKSAMKSSSQITAISDLLCYRTHVGFYLRLIYAIVKYICNSSII